MTDNLPIEKRKIPSAFNDIAHAYDFLNHFLSFGIDKFWRKKMVQLVPASGEILVLDLATGTGDVAIEVAKKRKEVKQVIGCDPAYKMVELAKQKVLTKKLDKKISFVIGDAQNLPFEDSYFECMTMAFGLRNIPDRKKGLQEIFRVLKNNGVGIILEFSIPENYFFKKGYLLYFKYLLPFLGGLISRNFKAYKYLNKSVEDFPLPSQISNEMTGEGFEVHYKQMSLGIVTLYTILKK